MVTKVFIPIYLLCCTIQNLGYAFPKEINSFLSNHCFECHGTDVQKGDLNLEELNDSIEKKELIELWTHVYDRTQEGEMPPKKKTRPTTKELNTFHNWLSTKLIEGDQMQKEVVHRRLNREEYQNTMNQLLHLNLDFKSMLPDDQIYAGFDNNGEALALSTELMSRYLKAAKWAINSAINKQERPKTEVITVPILKKIKKYQQGKFFHHDNHLVVYTNTNFVASPISSGGKSIKHDGRYRISFSALTYNSKDNQYFNVTVSDYARNGQGHRSLGYFEAKSTPQKYTIERNFKKGEGIQAFPFKLHTSNRKKKGNEDRPGIAFGPITIEGPLNESWPPESHQSLFGNINLAKGTLKDAQLIINRFMPKAFRRPVLKSETKTVISLIDHKLKEGLSFEESLKIGLVAILCSPQFLYLQEEKSNSQNERINDYEIANRLSYFLWSSMPDEELFDLAKKGTLSQSQVLDSQIERMIKHDLNKNFVSNFTGQWLKLRDLNETTPDKKFYPKYDKFLEESILKESEAFFENILHNDLKLETFLDSDFLMLNYRLAKHYKIEGIDGVELKPVKINQTSLRGGILTQAALLKVTANGTTTSPVTRGVWILENILGRHTPNPPPNIEGIEPDISGATTIRETLKKHREVQSCQACHQLIDPLGFALENFDPVGNFRTQYLKAVPNPVNPDWWWVEKSAKIDATGTMKDGSKFNNIHDFKAWLLNNSSEFKNCLTEKLLTYALGRKMSFSDRKPIQTILAKVDKSDGGLKQLIHEIVKSPIFLGY